MDKKDDSFTIKGWIIILSVLLGLGALIIWGVISVSNSNIDLDIQVDTSEIPTRAVHWHTSLTVTMNDKNIRLPRDIGLTSGHYPFHTHDESGELPIENENPQLMPEAMYLGSLFEQWGKVFNESCIFDSCTDSGELHMFVNGEENFEYHNYFMGDGDRITIEYISKDN